MDFIHVEGVSKAYADHHVLNELTLDIHKGECFTLLGPSGCGKTVLLRLIAGFEVPDQGKLYIDETLVSDPGEHINVPPENRAIGVVFQDYAVWPHMTVFDNIAYPLKIAKCPKDEIEKRVMEMVDLVAMRGLEKRFPSELSGGQQQRVALARALVAKPNLLLLDEPIANLDANLREEMRFEIKDLQQKYGFSIIYVTHDQSEAMALSDRILVMKLGVVQQIDTPLNIYNHPANKFVFSFIGLSNFLQVGNDNGNAAIAGGSAIPKHWAIPDELKGEGVLSLASRPSEIDFVSADEPEAIKGVVTRKAYLGEIIDYQLKMGDQLMRIQKGRRDPGPEVGETAAVKLLRPFWYREND